MSAYRITGETLTYINVNNFYTKMTKADVFFWEGEGYIYVGGIFGSAYISKGHKIFLYTVFGSKSRGVC